MNGIIKRRKTSDYAQIHNGALQQLVDIRSIGLISHLMSLPESWVISKMQLYNKSGRGPITNAIKELESKKYWVTIQYREGKKNFYYYNVSDVQFSDTEVLEMISEVEDAGYKIIALSEIFSHLLSIVENQQLKGNCELFHMKHLAQDITQDPSEIVNSSIVGNEQLTVNNSPSTVENRHLINKKEKTKSNKQNIDKENIVNLQGIDNFVNPIQFKIALLDACNSYYTEFAPSRWSKQSWLTLIEKFVNETIENERYITVPEAKIKSYAYASIKNMAHKVDLRNGKIEVKSSDEVPFYDWLN